MERQSFTEKKKEISSFAKDMDKPGGHHAKGTKPGTGKQISHNLMYVRFY